MKKVLALILVMTSMCCSFITVVAADEDIVSYGAIQKPTQEDIAAADGYLKYNGIDLEAMEESVETALRNRAQNANVELANFPHYTQQDGMTCAYACIRMVLRYFNETVPSEASIISSLGDPSTNGANMLHVKNYLNDRQDDVTFVISYSMTKTYMLNSIHSAIATYENPAIIAVLPSHDNGYTHDFGGGAHAVCLYGISTDHTDIEISDPWGGYVPQNDAEREVGSCDEQYDINADDFYRSYNPYNLGMIW